MGTPLGRATSMGALTNYVRPLLACLAGSAAGQQGTAQEEDVVSFYQRTLSADGAPYDHNFPVGVPTVCHRSSYLSPYRVYVVSSNPDVTPDATVFSFELDTAACPMTSAYCCGQPFDHLLIKTGEAAMQPPDAWPCAACMCLNNPSMRMRHMAMDCSSRCESLASDFSNLSFCRLWMPCPSGALSSILTRNPVLAHATDPGQNVTAVAMDDIPLSFDPTADGINITNLGLTSASAQHTITVTVSNGEW